jgi:hypothetical protein
MPRLLACACFASLFLFSTGTQAAIIASDSAADPVYAAWDPGDNGGSGWGGGWTFRNQSNTVLTTTNSNRGWFVGSSLSNNSPAGSDSNGDGDINSPIVDRAWGLYSNTTDQVYAIRPFTSALQVGQTVKWDMDNGSVASGQVVGLRFLSNASDINSRLFEARFVGGDSNYTIIGNPNQTTSIPFSREGLHLEYTLTSPTTYSLSILRLSTGATQTITGSNVSAGSIVALAFKNQFAGSGAGANAYLNNISISTPNVGPTVMDDVINNVMANDPNNNPLLYTFSAIDPDMDPLTWSGFSFASYTPAYGGNGPGPAIAATFDPNTQQFSWNTTGSPRGIYQWVVSASDGQASDEGTLTIHVTEVPEPASVFMLLVGGIVLGAGCRQRIGCTE